MKNKSFVLFSVLACALILLSACGPAATAAPVVATEAPTEQVPVLVPTLPPPTAAPTDTPPCLIIGATYGGPITDAGYNQAMHEAVMEVKNNIPCVMVIEAENVPD